jgi:hypothetical protein
MEAVFSSETSAVFHGTTLRHIAKKWSSTFATANNLEVKRTGVVQSVLVTGYSKDDRSSILGNGSYHPLGHHIQTGPRVLPLIHWIHVFNSYFLNYYTKCICILLCLHDETPMLSESLVTKA